MASSNMSIRSGWPAANSAKLAGLMTAEGEDLRHVPNAQIIAGYARLVRNCAPIWSEFSFAVKGKADGMNIAAFSAGLSSAGKTMVAITADIPVKSNDTPKVKAEGRLDLALAMHLAACRFSSPAGVAFLPQSYLPLLSPGKGRGPRDNLVFSPARTV